MLFGIAQKYAQKPAITWYPRTGCAQTKSYRDLEMDAFLFAEALCAHGLQGKHIAIAAENSYEWVCAFLGIVACGSVAICIDAEQTAESMLGMAKCADAEMVLVSQRVAPSLCPLLLEADIQTVVMGAYRGVQSLEEFCSAGRELTQGKDTVSYTHLDVYKRQGCGRRSRKRRFSDSQQRSWAEGTLCWPDGAGLGGDCGGSRLLLFAERTAAHHRLFERVGGYRYLCASGGRACHKPDAPCQRGDTFLHRI